MQRSMVRDPALAPDGHRKIDWAADHSPVLNTVRDKYLKDGTFEGLGVGVALPVEAKTAYLTVVLAEAGADVAVASPGPFFVQDDVAAALAERGGWSTPHPRTTPITPTGSWSGCSTGPRATGRLS